MFNSVDPSVFRDASAVARVCSSVVDLADMAESGREIGEAISVCFKRSGDVGGFLGGQPHDAPIGETGGRRFPGMLSRRQLANPSIQPGLGWKPPMRTKRLREWKG